MSGSRPLSTPLADCGDFLCPFVFVVAEVEDTFARQQGQPAAPSQAEESGGFAAGYTSFLIQPQDSEFPSGFGGLRWRAEQSQEFAGESDG